MREYEEYEENTHTRYEKDERRDLFYSPLLFYFRDSTPIILLLPPSLCAFSHRTFISVNISLYISRGFMV